MAILLVVAGSIWFGAQRVRQMSLVQFQHEGDWLADALESAIRPLVARGNFDAVQRHIDALVALRPANDVEINVLVLRGDGSEIAASNAPGNIEASDEEEHVELLGALRAGTTTMYVDTVDGWEDAEDEIDATDPDLSVDVGAGLCGAGSVPGSVFDSDDLSPVAAACTRHVPVWGRRRNR